MNFSSAAIISASIVALATGCNDKQSLEGACKSLGNVDVLDKETWKLAKPEIAKELNSRLNFISGLKAFQTTNFTITPIEDWDHIENIPNIERRAFLVTLTDKPKVQIARIHGASQIAAIPTRDYKGIPTSCFGIKNWVQEL